MTGEAIELFDPFDFNAITDRTLSSDEVFGTWTDCEGRVFENVEDWTHANSIYVASKGNLLFSIRHRDQIISIAPGYGSMEWRLGGPGGEFQFLNPYDRFYHQHSAKELPNGNILLFDNGNSPPADEGGADSRALELKIALERKTAVKVWEYRHVPDLYAECCSNVVRLPNGNTLIVFGFDDRAGGGDCCRVFTAVEADAAGNEVWKTQMRSPGTEQTCCAYPIFSLGGEARR